MSMDGKEDLMPLSVSNSPSSKRLKLTVIWFAIAASLILLTSPAHAQCPAIGNDTTCGTIITVTNTTVSISTTKQGPYDGNDDTLVGVVNSSSKPIMTLTLASTLPVFGFDGDGIVTYGTPGNSQDSSGYGGPNAYFTNINADQTAGVVHFITPIPPGGSSYFSLENDITAAYSCQQVVNNSVPKPAGGGTSISATFTPNLGLSISEAAAYCGFVDFNWIQKITSLPDPSPFFAVNPADAANPIHLTSTSAPFNDPYPSGYTYNPAWVSYPFYWDANSTTNAWSLARYETAYTLRSYDAPADPCLAGGHSAGVKGCNGTNAPAGSKISFTTTLAGILPTTPPYKPNSQAVDLGIGYSWTSNFNGTSGGIAVIGSSLPVDPGSGTGGVAVTSYTPTTTYQYNGVVVNQVNGNPVPTLFGLIETPANNSTNLAGAVAVTGWALSLTGVANVAVWREPISGETPQSNGLVFVGNATIVPGARPDVAAAYPNYPNASSAGWGLQVLTNELPGTGGNPIGNGNYKIHVIATDIQGQTVDLGTVAISVNNLSSIVPFGTIDSPAPGAVVSGAAYASFGWVLTPRSPAVIPTNGSTLYVVIDTPCSAVIPKCNPATVHPTAYNLSRCDVDLLFPSYTNSGSTDCAKNGTSPGPVGYLLIDTTKLANGLHSMAWVVTDSAGNAQGLGSRYFIVQN